MHAHHRGNRPAAWHCCPLHLLEASGEEERPSFLDPSTAPSSHGSPSRATALQGDPHTTGSQTRPRCLPSGPTGSGEGGGGGNADRGGRRRVIPAAEGGEGHRPPVLGPVSHVRCPAEPPDGAPCTRQMLGYCLSHASSLRLLLPKALRSLAYLCRFPSNLTMQSS